MAIGQLFKWLRDNWFPDPLVPLAIHWQLATSCLVAWLVAGDWWLGAGLAGGLDWQLATSCLVAWLGAGDWWLGTGGWGLVAGGLWARAWLASGLGLGWLVGCLPACMAGWELETGGLGRDWPGWWLGAGLAGWGWSDANGFPLIIVNWPFVNC